MLFSEAGIDGLTSTKAWIREAFEKLQVDSTLGPSTPSNILREAYLALLTWEMGREFPEVSRLLYPRDFLNVYNRPMTRLLDYYWNCFWQIFMSVEAVPLP